MNGTRFFKFNLFLFVLTFTMILGGPAWAKVFYVINLNDSGAGSLRDAMIKANVSAGIDQVYFLVSGTIKVNSPLPSVTSPLRFNSSNPCSNVKTIQLLGNNLPTGLDFQSGSNGSWVRGMAIGGFGTGISLNGVNGFTMDCTYVGTNVNGLSPVPNGVGVSIKVMSQNIDIGLDLSRKNIITGNQAFDLVMESGTQDVRVQGNYIGVGRQSIPIGALNQAGIYVFQSNNVSIGGSFNAKSNVISNHETGILLVDSSGISIDGNFIGTNFGGFSAAPNAKGIVLKDGSAGVDIGHNVATRNIISGNLSKDIVMEFETQDVRVKSNYIGVDVNGVALGQTNDAGIDLSGANNVVIGGVLGAEGNLIANHKVDVSLKDTHDISVFGNYIGIGSNGLAIGPLNQKGIHIESSQDLSIGEKFGVSGNVISNHESGVFITGSNGVVMLGNLIGTNPAGDVAVKNIEGVVVSASANIGFGATPEFKNIIAGNEQVDVLVNEQTHNVTFQNNHIGVGVNGVAINPMNEAGISLYSAQDVVIGGAVGLGNVISNHKFGVYAESSSRVNMYGNFIGSNPDGTSAVPNLKGVLFASVLDSNIGSDWAHRNVIAFNQGPGVALNQTSQNVQILSNSMFNNQVPGVDMSNFFNHTPSIDLNIDGISPHDMDDLDGGANHTLNYVRIRSLQLINNGTSLKLQYKLEINTAEATEAKIQFFANPSYVNSLQGQLLIGEATLPAIKSFADIIVPLNGVVDPVLIKRVSASTTVNNIGTSEFTAAANVTVVAPTSGTTTQQWSPVP